LTRGLISRIPRTELSFGLERREGLRRLGFCGSGLGRGGGLKYAKDLALACGPSCRGGAGHSRTRARVWLGDECGEGDDRWGLPVGGYGSGREWVGLVVTVRPAGPSGLQRVNRQRKMRGGDRLCLRGCTRRWGRKRGSKGKNREGVLYICEKAQSNELKFKFEFQQPSA
jgi:hypothetical protein